MMFCIFFSFFFHFFFIFFSFFFHFFFIFFLSDRLILFNSNLTRARERDVPCISHMQPDGSNDNYDCNRGYDN